MRNTPAAVAPAEAAASLAELAKRISAEHGAVCAALERSLERARAAGELLLEAKKRLPHGRWLSWLQTTFDFSVRTAQAYMRVARDWEALSARFDGVAGLGYREALELLADTGEEEPGEAAEGGAKAQPVAHLAGGGAADEGGPPRAEPPDATAPRQTPGHASPARPSAATTAPLPAPAAAEATRGRPGPEATSAAEEDQGGRGDPEAPRAAPVDILGFPLPPQAVEAFAQVGELNKLCRALDAVIREVERLRGLPVGWNIWQSDLGDLRHIRWRLWSGRPGHVCPYCWGEEAFPDAETQHCVYCKGCGWVKRSDWENALPEYKTGREESREARTLHRSHREEWQRSLRERQMAANRLDLEAAEAEEE
jgi:hypothetical protein